MPLIFRDWASIEKNYNLPAIFDPDFLAELRDAYKKLSEAAAIGSREIFLSVVASGGKPKVICGQLKDDYPVRLFPGEAMRIVFRPNGEMSVSMDMVLISEQTHQYLSGRHARR